MAHIYSNQAQNIETMSLKCLEILVFLIKSRSYKCTFYCFGVPLNSYLGMPFMIVKHDLSNCLVTKEIRI